MSRKQAIRLEVLRTSTPTRLRLAVQSFLTAREAAGCTSATLTWYRKYLAALVGFLEENHVQDPEAVTADLLRRYLVAVQRTGVAPRTVHHHASAARAFLNFLQAEGVVADNPMRKVAMPRLPKKILPALSPDDVKALLRACRTARDRAILLCLLDSGLRALEFVNLRVGDVDLSTGAVRVRSGKGRKDRVAFLGAKARKALTRYLMERRDLAPDAPLWASERTARP